MHQQIPTFRVCLAFRANKFLQEENKITQKEAPLEEFLFCFACLTLHYYKALRNSWLNLCLKINAWAIAAYEENKTNKIIQRQLRCCWKKCLWYFQNTFTDWSFTSEGSVKHWLLHLLFLHLQSRLPLYCLYAPQQQKPDAVSSLSYNSTSQCLLRYIIQIVYPLRSVRSDTAAFQLIFSLKIHFSHHVQKMNPQEQNEIKIPHHAVLWTLQRFCAPISYLGCEIFLAGFITSDRGITSRTNGHRFVLAAGPCSVCQLTAPGWWCSAVPPSLSCTAAASLSPRKPPCQVGPACSPRQPAVAPRFSRSAWHQLCLNLRVREV